MKYIVIFNEDEFLRLYDEYQETNIGFFGRQKKVPNYAFMGMIKKVLGLKAEDKLSESQYYAIAF